MTIPDLTSEDSRKPIFKRKRATALRWIWRLFLVLCIFIAIILGALSFISGSSPSLEKAFEQHLSQVMNKDVSFEKLNYVSVFPTVTIDFEGLSIRPLPVAAGQPANSKQDTPGEMDPASDESDGAEKTEQDREETDNPDNPGKAQDAENKPQTEPPQVITLGSFRFETSFWNIILGRRIIHDVALRDLEIREYGESAPYLIITDLDLDPDAYSYEVEKPFPVLNFPVSSGTDLLQGRQGCLFIKIPPAISSVTVWNPQTPFILHMLILS